MIVKFFSTGTGGGAGPVNYLIAEEVLAYNENRNLIRDEAGQPQIKIREPRPEVVRGNPDQTRDLIDASTNKWSYTAGVVSFALNDQPTVDQQQEAIDRFEELAFAGLEADQYDCLWVRHVHEGNVELHFCTPRLELTEGKSLNIAPPGHEHAFRSLADLLNDTHQWADPLEPDRVREFKPVRESSERAEARAAITTALYDQIDAGLVEDRASMIAFFEEAGFEISRRAEKSISVRDPDFQKPFKLEGVLTHENWSADRHDEIAADYQAGESASGTSRLDRIPDGEIRAAFDRHVERRSEYNRQRYGQFHERDAPDRYAEITLDAPDVSVRTLDRIADDLDRNDGPDGNERRLELENQPDANDDLWFEQSGTERSDLPDFGPANGQAGNMHDSQQVAHMPGGHELDEDTAPDSTGTRTARLRRTVGNVIRHVRENHDRFGSPSDGADGQYTGYVDRMRDLLSPVTKAINRCAEFVDERVRELRTGRAELSTEYEAVADRTEAFATELTAMRRAKFHFYER